MGVDLNNFLLRYAALGAENGPPWTDHFRIESTVDLDFVIGQTGQFPVGMSRKSPPEFRRRVAAAMKSYLLQLSSVDYTLKRYVPSDLYENEEQYLGDSVSDYLRDRAVMLGRELRALHTPEPTFGQFGAEMTLFRLPDSLDTARMLSNRGLLLEVVPLLRLCLEMLAWANVAFCTLGEADVVHLKAQSCVGALKRVYETAGRIYYYHSQFSHWSYAIHGQFLDVGTEQVSVLSASVRYRAIALAACLVVLDVFVEVCRNYASSSCCFDKAGPTVSTSAAHVGHQHSIGA